MNDIEIAHKKLQDNHFIFTSEWFNEEYFKDENNNDFPDEQEKLIHLEKEILKSYEAVLNPSDSFWDRVRAFMSASSKAGRGAKAIKDFMLLFTPYGKQIGSVTEFVSERFIQSKQKQNEAEDMNWLFNRLTEQSTWRGIIVAVTGAGVGIAPQLQELIIPAGVSLFALIEFFVKEPQSADA